MNITFAAMFLVFFIIWFVLRFIFRNAISPYMHDKARFKLFAMRDELRACEHLYKDHDDFCFRFMEGVINSAIRGISSFGIIEILKFSPTDKERKETEHRMKKFEKNAPPELKDMDKRVVMTVIGAMAFNSPFLMSFGFIFYTASKFISAAATPVAKFKTNSINIIHANAAIITA